MTTPSIICTANSLGTISIGAGLRILVITAHSICGANDSAKAQEGEEGDEVEEGEGGGGGRGQGIILARR